MRTKQAKRKVSEYDAKEFIDNLERLHAEVLRNLRAGNVVTAHELIGDLRDSVTDFLNDPLNHVVTRFRYIDTPERGQDPEYDSLVDERRRNYEAVDDLYPGKELAERIRGADGSGG